MSKKSKTVHIVCILDRSGSMMTMENEVVGGFNNFITEQRKIEGKAKVTLVLFDDQYDVIYDKIPLDVVPELTSDIYYARGMTALNDSIGKTIKTFAKKKKVIVLIQTDGEENASREYTASDVKSLVEGKTKDGWDFNFLGVGIDAIKAGTDIGVMRSKSVSFAKTTTGFLDQYDTMSVASTSYRVS